MSSVRVVLRIRPLANPNVTPALSIPPEQNPYPRVIQTLSNSQYTFDYVASPAVTQKQLFEAIGRPVIDSCLEGYNGTIFCYGQTGSGKTYTMTGPDTNDNKSKEDRGMIPRILECLFEKIDTLKNQNTSLEFYCTCSFLEIYNEQIMDLLGEPNKNIQLREDVVQGVYAEGLNHKIISNPQDALDILYSGLEQRHTGETKANAKSSRSHSVFTIYIQSKEIGEITTTKSARLNLIDLAGSERQTNTNAEGMRLTEACNINKSLSTLGQVILALSERQKGRSMHVHYRDSKLTFLLRDSLGGNSKTCIVGNVSAEPKDLSETISTLDFAKRAKRIRNKPIANENVTGNIALLQEQIRRLRFQLIEAHEKLANAPTEQLISNPSLQNGFGSVKGYSQASSITHSRLGQGETFEDQLDDLSEIHEVTFPFRLQPKEGESFDQFITYLKNVSISSCQYNRRLRRVIRRNYDTMDVLVKLFQSTEKLFLACRFALKSREWELAKVQSRKPQLDLFHRGKDGVISIDLDNEMLADVDNSFEYDENGSINQFHSLDALSTNQNLLTQIDEDDSNLDIEYTHIDDDDPYLDLDDDEEESFSNKQLSNAEKILLQIYHPENNPYVLRHMYEALEWKNRCFDIEDVDHDNEYYESLKQAITYCERKLTQDYVELKKLKDELKNTKEKIEKIHKVKEVFQKKNEEIKDIWNQKMEWENRYKVLQEKLKRQQILLDEQTIKMNALQTELSKKQQHEEEGNILKKAYSLEDMVDVESLNVEKLRNEELKKENQTLLQIIESLEHDKEALSFQYKNEFELEAEKFSMMMDQKDQEVSELRRQIVEFQERFTLQQKQILELEEISTAEIEELKLEINQKSEETQQLRNQLHMLQMDNNSSELRRMQQIYEDQLNESCDRIIQLQNQLELSKSQVEKLEHCLQQSLNNEHITQMEQQKLELQNRLSQADDEIIYLKSEISTMEKFIQENKNADEDLVRHANDTVSEKLAELNFELRQLRDQKLSVDEDKENLEKEIQLMKQKEIEKDREIELRKQKEEQMAQEIEKLRKELAQNLSISSDRTIPFSPSNKNRLNIETNVFNDQIHKKDLDSTRKHHLESVDDKENAIV